MATGGHFLKTFTKKVAQVIWTMFEPTAGRLQLDINSLLVNIYIHTDSYVGNEGIYIVFALGRVHTIIVLNVGSGARQWWHKVLHWYTFALVILFTQLQYGACTFMYMTVCILFFFKFVYSCCLNMYNYIPEIWKFRGYYVFGSAAVSAVSAVSTVSTAAAVSTVSTAAAARQRLYRP